MKLTDFLKSHGFTVSAEVIPPRNGSEMDLVLRQVGALVEAGAQFLSVTKGAGGSLRGGSLPIAQMIKESYRIPAIAHFTCRDLTPFEVENQLIAHHYFGIRNILALRGDPPDGQPEWKPREGGYSYAYQLIEQIQKMNQGVYLERAGGPAPASEFREKTDFCIGAAAYPEFEDPVARVEYLRLKVQAGAEYAMTDMIFDPELYARYLDECGARGIRVPILPGTRLLKSKAQAERMAKKFKVSVPAALLQGLPEGEGAKALGPSSDEQKKMLECSLKNFEIFVQRMKSYGAPGVHVYVIADPQSASEAIRRVVSV